MEPKMKRALSEVNEVLTNSDYEVLNKIPQKFFDYLNANMDNEYKPTIIPGGELINQPISQEAKELLGLVYRDFLSTPEEREKLVSKEKTILNKINNDVSKDNVPTPIVQQKTNQFNNLNVENINANNVNENKESINQTNDEKSLVKFQEKWYKNLWSKIKNRLKFWK